MLLNKVEPIHHFTSKKESKDCWGCYYGQREKIGQYLTSETIDTFRLQFLWRTVRRNFDMYHVYMCQGISTPVYFYIDFRVW